VNFSKQNANEQQCYKLMSHAPDDSAAAPERAEIQILQQLYLIERYGNIHNSNFASGCATWFLTLIKENTCSLRIFQYTVTKLFGPKRKDTRKCAYEFPTTYLLKFLSYTCIALYSNTLSAT
jgi:hypothetical protein